MAEKRAWDLTTTNALQAAATWLLRKSGALLVCVVRVDDLAIAGDPKLAPRDVLTVLDDRLVMLHERLQESRREALAKADKARGKGR